MKDQYTLPLSDSEATIEIVGGKGVSLAHLEEAELPVPGGYHITTAAYRQFVKQNNLGPAILAALQGVDIATPATLVEASKTINHLFTSAPIPGDIAKKITAALTIPTIGIGAGPDCDGQILVLHDMLGLNDRHLPKFVKQYARLGDAAREAIENYAKEVADGSFPAEEHCY